MSEHNDFFTQRFKESFHECCETTHFNERAMQRNLKNIDVKEALARSTVIEYRYKINEENKYVLLTKAKGKKIIIVAAVEDETCVLITIYETKKLKKQKNLKKLKVKI